MSSYVLNIACSPYNSFEKRNVRVQIKCEKDLPESTIDPAVFAYRRINGEYCFDHVCSTVDMVDYPEIGTESNGESFKWARSDTVDILVRTLSIASDFIAEVKSDVKLLYMNMCAHNNIVGTEVAVIGNTYTLELDRLAGETSIDRIPFGDVCKLTQMPVNGGTLTIHDDHVWFTPKLYVPGEDLYTNDSFSYTLTNPDGVVFNYSYFIKIKPYDAKGFVQQATTDVHTPVTVNYTDISDLNTWLDDSVTWSINSYPRETREGLVTKISDTELQYTPNGTYIGDDDFDYRVTDGKRDAVIHCVIYINE